MDCTAMLIEKYLRYAWINKNLYSLIKEIASSSNLFASLTLTAV